MDACFAALAAYWDDKLSRLQVNTPNENMNTSLNTWNLYQSEVNHLFSRFASFIEVGGRTGLGYRDTAQDAMCVPHSNPDKCRSRILELLRGETKAGYGLHLFQPEWFDPDKADVKPFKSPTVVPEVHVRDIIGDDLSNVCADDALWLVPAIVEYIRETGELSLLDEVVTYADGGEGTVYEHMTRILDFTDRQTGMSGVAKGLRADWNDCLNLGGGESAMVSFLHVWAIGHFLDAARAAGRAEDTAKYEAMGRQGARGLQPGSCGTARGISGASPPTGGKSAPAGTRRGGCTWSPTPGPSFPAWPGRSGAGPPWTAWTRICIPRTA